MRKRNRSAAILLLLAALGFGMVARSPRFDAMRNVDILQLLSSGGCLGAALVLLVRRREQA